MKKAERRELTDAEWAQGRANPYVAESGRPCRTCDCTLRYKKGGACWACQYTRPGHAGGPPLGKGAGNAPAPVSSPPLQTTPPSPQGPGAGTDLSACGFSCIGQITLDASEQQRPVFPRGSDKLCGYYAFAVDGIATQVGYTKNWARRHPHYRNGPDAANRRIREHIRHEVRAGHAVTLWALEAATPTGTGEGTLRRQLNATGWHGTLPPLFNSLESHKARLAYALHSHDDAATLAAARAYVAAADGLLTAIKEAA